MAWKTRDIIEFGIYLRIVVERFSQYHLIIVALVFIILKKSKVKAVYVTPSHQFPTGIVMPITRRMELLEWAREENAYIIEDDYDGEFRYSGKPIPALHGLDSYENVVYMGTFSKSLIPSIKLSYMVLPIELINLYKKNNFYVQTVSRLHQHTLRLFMESGHWERHLNKSRNIYKGRHLALLNAIHQVMNNDVKVYGSGSGLHILLEPNNHMTEKQLIQTARVQGVIIYPTSVFFMPILQKINQLRYYLVLQT